MLRIPNNEPKSMTKMAETRRPIRPSKSLSERHAGVVSTVVAAADADGRASRRTTLAMVALSVLGDIDAKSQSSAFVKISFLQNDCGTPRRVENFEQSSKLLCLVLPLPKSRKQIEIERTVGMLCTNAKRIGE